MTLRISLPGYDVKKASGNQLSVTSDSNQPKIRSRNDPPHFGYIEHNVTQQLAVGEYVIKSIKHEYDRTPMFLVHYDHPDLGVGDGGASSGLLRYVPGALLVRYEWVSTANESEAKIIFKVNLSTSAMVGEKIFLRYYIFAERGA